MFENEKSKMTKFKANFAVALLIATGSFVFSSPAFAISSIDECNAAVKSATRDLLKANVKMDALGPIDAALISAEAKCVSQDFAGAEADLANAKSLIAAAAQN